MPRNRGRNHVLSCVLHVFSVDFRLVDQGNNMKLTKRGKDTAIAV